MGTKRYQVNLELCRQMAEQCGAITLRKAARRVAAAYDHHYQADGLSGAQVSVLVAVALAGEPGITQLAELLDLDQTTLSRNVRPLEKQRIVRIGRGDDKRLRTVSLTPHGEDVLNAALRRWQAAQSEFLGQVGGKEWPKLLSQLHALSNHYKSK